MSTAIDWTEQWKNHAHDFKEGKAHIPLPNGEEITLLPGPGFGDYSHPTTRLMIEMMHPHVVATTVFDIGCGSGILSIASAKLGATKIFVCDIDPDAVTHTLTNASFNNAPLEDGKPTDPKTTILMNMIFSEQKQAWLDFNIPFETLITSGILPENKTEYLNFAKSNGWKLIQEYHLNGWLGFIFKENFS